MPSIIARRSGVRSTSALLMGELVVHYFVRNDGHHLQICVVDLPAIARAGGAAARAPDA
jgi:hypothetical protein